jgi:hypothetical protein
MGRCSPTMRSSGPRGEAIVFPDVVSARGRLTRRWTAMDVMSRAHMSRSQSALGCVVTLFVLALLLFPGSSEAGDEKPDPAYYTGASTDEQALRIEALKAAYAAMAEAYLESAGKVIIITPRAGMLIVSFLPAQANVYGGRAHVTYDPHQKKVVQVVGED